MLPSVGSKLILFCRNICFLSILIAPFLGAVIYFQNRDRERDQAQRNAPLQTIQSYLRATYARDYRQAYRFISAADQSFLDETSYVHAQEQFTGFTARLAGRLADFMELKVIEEVSDGDRLKVKVDYSVPSPEDVSSLVFNWDSQKLHSLSPAERKQLLNRLVARKRSGSLVSLQGHETFELIREGDSWKIFQGWSAGIRVKIETVLAEKSDVDVKLSQNEIIVKEKEPFQVNLKLKNRGRQGVILALHHRVEPLIAADDLEMIECGLRRPIALRPGSEQDFSMAYILSQSTRKNVRDLTLTYAFEIKK